MAEPPAAGMFARPAVAVTGSPDDDILIEADDRPAKGETVAGRS